MESNELSRLLDNAIARELERPTDLAEAAADKPPLERKCNQSGAGGLQGFPATDAECAAGAPGAPVGIVVWAIHTPTI